MTSHIGLALVVALHVAASAGAQNLATNGGFDQVREGRLPGWNGLWTRGAGAGSMAIDSNVFRRAAPSVRIEHRGQEDWSFHPDLSLPAREDEVYTLRCSLRVEGEGTATLCAIAYGEGQEAIDWSAGERTVTSSPDWRDVQTRVIVPAGTIRLVPRVIGEGPAKVWIDDFSVERTAWPGNAGAAAQVVLTNQHLIVALQTPAGTLSVTDRRTGQVWRQQAFSRKGLVTAAAVAGSGIQATWSDLTSDREYGVRILPDPAAPEIVVEVAGQGNLPQALAYPHPFVSAAGSYLIVPMNEGISYPVDDPTIGPMRLIAYGGHGICMPFWGVTDGRAGCMTLGETPDDLSLRIERVGGLLAAGPQWDAQRGQFGYTRRIRYAFFSEGGHVAMCKRYRAYAQKTGLFKSLAQKRTENPNVDLLVGAVNVWCWEKDAVGIVSNLQAAGIERILWSNQAKPDTLRALNARPGVLTSRYDIYQDLMDPEIVRTKLGWTHGDWTQEGYPADIMLDERGRIRPGWEVKGKDGVDYPCAVLCDARAVDYARKRVPAELAVHPYRCRFIDTTTASPWRECYHTNHPMTRSDSRRCKMDLLRYMSEEAKLVTGSETGHDASVPYVHYFEGMLSLGPYRVPDSGRRMHEIWTNVPERVAKFQLGHAYRLPLWELVYHDAVVAQWYWGDYNNKLPALWDKRDLFNALYGTPPMFMFSRSQWEENKARFVQSYQATCPLVRKVGYAEMTDHRFLTPDRSVQQTRFANGVTVTVNFGRTPFTLPDGTIIRPLSRLIIDG